MPLELSSMQLVHKVELFVTFDAMWYVPMTNYTEDIAATQTQDCQFGW